MKKLSAQENKIKNAIRDIVALDPMASTERIGKLLFEQGIRSAGNKQLDWRYIHKLCGKIHREGLVDLSRTEVAERVKETKERYRLFFGRLTRIAYGTEDLQKENFAKPNFKEQISAMSTMMKFDLALMKAEIANKVLKGDESDAIDRERSKPLPPETRAAIFSAINKRFKTDDETN